MLNLKTKLEPQTLNRLTGKLTPFCKQVNAELAEHRKKPQR